MLLFFVKILVQETKIQQIFAKTSKNLSKNKAIIQSIQNIVNKLPNALKKCTPEILLVKKFHRNP